MRGKKVRKQVRKSKLKDEYKYDDLWDMRDDGKEFQIDDLKKDGITKATKLYPYLFNMTLSLTRYLSMIMYLEKHTNPSSTLIQSLSLTECRMVTGRTQGE